MNDIEKLSDYVKEFANLLQEKETIYHKDHDIEAEMFNKQNDLLHDIEIPDLTYHEIARIGKSIRELRRNRRKYKNEYILYEPISIFIKSHPGIIDDLINLSCDIKKVEAHLDNQYYNKRSKIDDIEHTNKDDSSTDNVAREDLVSLNKIISKHSSEFTSTISSINGECVEYSYNITLDSRERYEELRDRFFQIKSSIEKYFKTDIESKYVEYRVSDMMSSDCFNVRKLDARIFIYDCGKPIAKINTRLYGKSNSPIPSKKKKGKKGRR